MKEIKLTKGLVAQVSDHRFDELNQYKWHATVEGYAARNYVREDGKRRILFMHNVIMNPPDGLEVDHKDGKPSNNSDDNLRNVTTQQNQFNSRKRKPATSVYKGVFWDKAKEFWCAKIKINYKSYFIGYFNTELEAAAAYNVVASMCFGEFALLNTI